MGALQTVGVQSEAEIEFAALHQLLRSALGGVGSLLIERHVMIYWRHSSSHCCEPPADPPDF